MNALFALADETLVYDGADGLTWFWLFFGPLVLVPFGLLILGSGVLGLLLLLEHAGVTGPMQRLRAFVPRRRPTVTARQAARPWKVALSTAFGLAFGSLLVWYGVLPAVNRFLPTRTFEGSIDAMGEQGVGRSRRKWMVIDGASWAYPPHLHLPLAAGDRVRIEVEYFAEGSVFRVWRRTRER